MPSLLAGTGPPSGHNRTSWWVPPALHIRHDAAMSASSRARRALALLAFLLLTTVALPIASSAAAKDTDKDGLPDTFERDKTHTSPTHKDTDHDGIPDGKENPDHDALNNRYEYLAGTNPRKGDTDHDGKGDGKEDPDHDGLTNKQEQDRGTLPRKADTDGDGYHDGTEVRAGTDPKNAASHPVPPSNPDGAPTIAGAPGCPIFPADNVWNTRIDDRDVASNSSTMISAIGLSRGLHMDFGSYAGYGIPINVVSGDTPGSTVVFQYDDESDHVPYPIPSSPKVEGGSDGHILMVDKDLCRLYELFAAKKVSGVWHAGSGATWDLRSNALRKAGWTSADAAGLPILPGLVRYDEVAAGEIDHALRFTTDQTRTSYIYPARHEAGDSSSSSLPPMGLRVRLKASYDISGFSPQARVIAKALQRYGMILADNGSPWFITGASDPSFDDDVMHQLDVITGHDLEVVDTTGLVNGP
jgi:hypothetical protein